MAHRKTVCGEPRLFGYSNILGCGKKGVVFRRREGLKQLIQDVVQRAAAYKAILVYDVSRWGCFQDCDEAAYYGL